MDIISHGLWATLLVKIFRERYAQSAHLGIAFLFGVIPDIIAFAFLTIWSTMNFGILHPEDHGASMTGTAGPFLNVLSETLYQFTHSLVVVLIVFLVIYVISRKIYIVLLGWPLHVLLDIPTHTVDFYPTPFLWPVSEFVVNGFMWSQE